ncbi:MAG: DUF5693 family protein [Candidatus Bipolaricaulota bacterium]|nr:DUF5693 family protein [Candidatus Bipolaricaulota bacterium]
MNKTLQIVAVVILGIALGTAVFVDLSRIEWERESKGFLAVVREEQAQGISLPTLKNAGIDTVALKASALLQNEGRTPEQIRDAGLNVALILDHVVPVAIADQGPFTTVWAEGDLPADDPLLMRLMRNGTLLILREFAPTLRAQELWEEGFHRVVRGHEIPNEDLVATAQEGLLFRWRRAMRERGIRALVLTPVPGESSDQTLAYYRGVVAQAAKEGYQQGDPFFPPPERNRFIPLILHLGVCALLLLVLLHLFEHLPIACLLLTAGVASLGAGLGGILLAQVDGLLLALLAPIYGTLLLMKRASAGWHDGTRLVLLFSGLSLGAALLLSAILAQPVFLLKIAQFRGVKVSLFLPPLVGAILAARHAGWKVLFHFPKGHRYSLFGVMLFALSIAAVAFILLRSGNGVGLVSTLEERTRNLLETIFYARPRFKEFLLGHPFLLLFGASGGLGAWALRYRPILLFFGLIGQAATLNTFAHAHTPLLFSLLRTANGLFLGLLFGTGLYFVLFLVRRWQRWMQQRT